MRPSFPQVRSISLSPILLIAVVVCYLPGLSVSAQPGRSDEMLQNWSQWRGPLATGEAPQANPPAEWNEKKNVRWKIELPGKGHSTPIVWDDRVFVTAAVPFGDTLEPRYSGRPGAHDNLPVAQRHKFMAIAVDRSTGRILWKQTLHEALPHEGGHYTASLASASPVTDGERLFVLFGSYGLYCLDMDGEVQWKVNLGEMHTKHGHGEGSSPVLYGDTLVVNWDHEGQSFLVAFDKNTGKKKWKFDRQEVTSWATPIVVEQDGKPQLIVSGTDRVRGYDLKTGKVIWQCGGLSANIVASPVSDGGMVFAGSSYEKRAMIAIRLEGAHGDITGSKQVLWTRRDMTPYVPSPLLYHGALYFLRHYQNVLSRVDATTGKDDGGPFRLGPLGDIYASPVAAAGRVYITGRNGVTLVMSDGAQPEALGMNRLDDSFSASAALAGNEILLRGEKFLYCIAKLE